MKEKIAKRTTLFNFIVNVILTLGKIIIGSIARSGALIADGIHSLSDLLTDIIVYVSIHISSKPADDDHNYGHGKFETVATMIVSVALIIAGYNIAKSGIIDLIDCFKGNVLPTYGSIVLYVAGISFLSKELMYRYTISKGRKIGSEVVIANAYHQRSDAISSLGVLIAALFIVIVGQSYSFMEPLAQLFVSFFLFKAAYQIFRPSLEILTEKSLNQDQVREIKNILQKSKKVCEFHHLRTRRIGSLHAIDVHVLVESDLSVTNSHQITVELEEDFKQLLGQATIISIHIEPCD